MMADEKPHEAFAALEAAANEIKDYINDLGLRVAKERKRRHETGGDWAFTYRKFRQAEDGLAGIEGGIREAMQALAQVEKDLGQREEVSPEPPFSGADS